MSLILCGLLCQCVSVPRFISFVPFPLELFFFVYFTFATENEKNHNVFSPFCICSSWFSFFLARFYLFDCIHQHSECLVFPPNDLLICICVLRALWTTSGLFFFYFALILSNACETRTLCYFCKI